MHQKNNLIVFDGNCNLCNYAVSFLQKRDKGNLLSFIPFSEFENLQQLPIQQSDFTNPNSLLFIQENRVYKKSDAILKILFLLPFPYPLLIGFWIVPRFLRDGVYAIIAKYRK